MYVPLGTLRHAVLLVDSVADLDDPAEFAATAMPGLGKLIGCDLVTYNDINVSLGQVRYADYPSGALDASLLDVFAAHMHEHPLINHFEATGRREPVKISDFLTQREFRGLGLYTEFFRLVGVEHQIAVGLAPNGSQVIGFALNRGRGDFTETDRDVLSSVREPLAAALARIQARSRARSVLAAQATAVLAALTDRELQILQLVAAGRTNGSIGRKLGISQRTVAKHLEHIYRKLGVTSRAAAVSSAAGAAGW